MKTEKDMGTIVLLPLSVVIPCKTSLLFITNSYKTPIIFTKPSITSTSVTQSSNRKSDRYQPISQANPSKVSSRETAYFHFESLQQNQSIKRRLLDNLKEKDSDPLQILNGDGDWSQELFWVVIKFLKQASRSSEILQVFYSWKNKEKSRVSEGNYEKVIVLLVDESHIEEAVLVLGDMKNHGLRPSLDIYNSIIHGFTREGKFEDALLYFKEMEEMDVKPDTEIFDGFIQAYGKYKMYDEMDRCVKQMESAGCSPDHVTYNLLIHEFSQAGLLKRMERTYQILISKRMDLQSSTLIAMLETYANFGILDKMEKVLRKVLNSNAPFDDNMIRKIVGVYTENYMFSRIEDLGFDLALKTGRTDLVWCLRMLSPACLLSRKGMDSVVHEFETEKQQWNVTIANILLLAYLKMKDFTRLNIVLSELPGRYVKPDIVTVGILYDAYRSGFDGTSALKIWRMMGFFDEHIEMNTDALVLTTFGKGHFLRSFEEVYSSFQPSSRKGKLWTYQHVIDLVVERKKMLIK